MTVARTVLTRTAVVVAPAVTATGAPGFGSVTASTAAAPDSFAVLPVTAAPVIRGVAAVGSPGPESWTSSAVCLSRFAPVPVGTASTSWPVAPLTSGSPSATLRTVTGEAVPAGTSASRTSSSASSVVTVRPVPSVPDTSSTCVPAAGARPEASGV